MLFALYLCAAQYLLNINPHASALWYGKMNRDRLVVFYVGWCGNVRKRGYLHVSASACKSTLQHTNAAKELLEN